MVWSKSRSQASDVEEFDNEAQIASTEVEAIATSDICKLQLHSLYCATTLSQRLRTLNDYSQLMASTLVSVHSLEVD